MTVVNGSTAPTPPPAQPDFSDMTGLITEFRSRFEASSGVQTARCFAPFDSAEFIRDYGFAERRKGKAEFVPASSVAVELGHPTRASQSLVLMTAQPELVRSHQMSLVGPDLDQVTTGERLPFGQVVLLELRPGTSPDPFEIESAQLLLNRLPGYMVRSVPGRLWVRVNKKNLAAGLSLSTVAKALFTAYEDDFPEVVGVEVFFITSSDEEVETLAPTVLEAVAIAGRHKKLLLSPDGDLDCVELNCETCEEQPVCDDLRDIIRERKRKK